MAAPVEPIPPWDEHLPPPLDCGDEQRWWETDPECADPDHPDGEDRDPDDLDEDRVEGPVLWAVPGLAAGDTAGGGGGLSGASVAVLAESAAAWRALRRAQARCYRALTALQCSDAVAESGYRNLARLLAEHVRVDTAEATRLARHARALTATTSPTGSARPAELPATAGLVTGGVIGPGHVEVIRRTMHRLAAVAGLDPHTLATTEAELAQLATTRNPAALAEAAAAILALLDPDGAAPDDQPLPENELHYLRRRNGDLVGRFTYRDPAAAEALHTALDVATPPADPAADLDPTGPRGESSGAHAARTLPERRAHALLDLAAEALTRGLNTDTPEHTTPADTAPDGLFGDDEDTTPEHDPAGPGESPGWTRADVEGGERVALSVTLNYDTLRGALTGRTAGGDGFTGSLALLGENTWVRPETARRLACDAELIPFVLGSRGEVLDLGRKNRLVSLALRRAVIQRDRHCAHPGCRRRARRCQVHHIIHWAHDGDTCPENCVLLCSYHHTLIHHSDWQIHMIDGLPWFTPPAWLDPRRRPRHNRPWQPDDAAVA